MVKALYHQTLVDATAFTDFVPFSKVLKPDCLVPTHGCAEAFILQWIDTAWSLFDLFQRGLLSIVEVTVGAQKCY